MGVVPSVQRESLSHGRRVVKRKAIFLSVATTGMLALASQAAADSLIFTGTVTSGVDDGAGPFRAFDRRRRREGVTGAGPASTVASPAGTWRNR
jgi:hypothetical protein